MKKPPFEKQVRFQDGKVLEVNKQNLDEDSFSSTDAEEGTHSRIRTLTTSQKHEFSYRKVSTQVLVVNCKGNWAQDSRRILSNITDCGYDTTHLQENPQRLG